VNTYNGTYRNEDCFDRANAVSTLASSDFVQVSGAFVVTDDLQRSPTSHVCGVYDSVSVTTAFKEVQCECATSVERSPDANESFCA
jgi:hypothetical protein